MRTHAYVTAIKILPGDSRAAKRNKTLHVQEDSFQSVYYSRPIDLIEHLPADLGAPNYPCLQKHLQMARHNRAFLGQPVRNLSNISAPQLHDSFEHGNPGGLAKSLEESAIERFDGDVDGLVSVKGSSAHAGNICA